MKTNQDGTKTCALTTCPDDNVQHIKPCTVVKTRKDHICQFCEQTVLKGEYMLYATLNLPMGHGLDTRYYCKSCLIGMECFDLVAYMEGGKQ